MVQEQASLDDIFHALADPTRRAMLATLASGPSAIGTLAAPFAMSFAAASKHVRVLERAGLVSRRIAGRTHICRIEPAPLARADEWLRVYQRYWTDRFDALEAVLEADKPTRQGDDP
jgi:DNA-binding transcriptional ArsR family regulator